MGIRGVCEEREGKGFTQLYSIHTYVTRGSEIREKEPQVPSIYLCEQYRGWVVLTYDSAYKKHAVYLGQLPCKSSAALLLALFAHFLKGCD